MAGQGAVIVAARRTPFATAGRALGALDAAALAAPVLRALVDDLADLGISGPVDDVVLGCCCGPGGDEARIAALAAGLGTGVPGVTVDRQCGSGLEAVRLAAAAVAAGQADLVLAGGSESGSAWSGRRAAFTPPGWPDPQMGDAADDVAAARRISRDRQDAYAERSHRLALTAIRAGMIAPEIVPVAGMSSDDRPRPGLDRRALARFRPAFRSEGTVTAGNACGINDGAAVVAVVSAAVQAEAGVPGLRVLASGAVGIDPALPGLGAADAAQAVLARAQVRLDDVAVVEVQEAFAAQVLACTDALGLDPLGADDHRVCPQGGAIAYGHPWGASGAFLLVRLFSLLVRCPAGQSVRPRGTGTGPLGLAACAVGGGQGVALLVERVGP